MWWHSQGEADLRAESDWLSPTERQRSRGMRFTKRRTEWLLARWTAKNALAATLELPTDPGSLARIEIRTILRGPAQGAPEVFIDGREITTSVSMTDRAGWAVCTGDELGDIGCDLELVEPRSDQFVEDFFVPREQNLVHSPPFDASSDLVANLIWSAKESALKVLRSGLRRDTRSVEVAFFPGDPVDGWRALVTQPDDRPSFTGWWRQYGAFLLTVVGSRQLPPPRPIREPPGLAKAAPSHSWMEAPIVLDDPSPPPT
jgi:4'-phosphopantetheinyl transferase